MYEFRVHTLVDITENGVLSKPFPFKTPSGEVVHDRQTLAIARNQNNNFNTMLQLLQIRGNITWENPPKKIHDNIINTKFGTAYADKSTKQTSWHFQFFTEQTDVYGDESTNNVGQLVDDFDLVPVLAFCKETVTFPSNTFITQDDQTINTYFSYEGFQNK